MTPDIGVQEFLLLLGRGSVHLDGAASTIGVRVTAIHPIAHSPALSPQTSRLEKRSISQPRHLGETDIAALGSFQEMAFP
jgi:hypothetical protein